jgi:hypothetical protein
MVLVKDDLSAAELALAQAVRRLDRMRDLALSLRSAGRLSSEDFHQFMALDAVVECAAARVEQLRSSAGTFPYTIR